VRVSDQQKYFPRKFESTPIRTNPKEEQITLWLYKHVHLRAREWFGDRVAPFNRIYKALEYQIGDKYSQGWIDIVFGFYSDDWGCDCDLRCTWQSEKRIVSEANPEGCWMWHPDNMKQERDTLPHKPRGAAKTFVAAIEVKSKPDILADLRQIKRYQTLAAYIDIPAEGQSRINHWYYCSPPFEGVEILSDHGISFIPYTEIKQE
jgi:hypothetical protein